MTININTPNGTPFGFDIKDQIITITSQNGNTHQYLLDSLRDLYFWLKVTQNGNWVLLGTKGEEETPNEGTVEEWARSPNNPVRGFYGLSNGKRGRFASFVPSILEYLGFVEIEHNPKNNRIRSK